MADLALDPKVESKLKGIVRKTKTISIVTHSDMEVAGVLVKQISDLKTEVENTRTSFTKPLNESLRTINAWFKKFSVPLDEADKEVRRQMVDFGNQLPEDASNNFGEVHFTTATKFKVVDIKKVPVEYLKVDEVAINKAIAAGATKIKGIEIVKEKRVSL